MSRRRKGGNAEAYIERDHIVIRVPVSVLPGAVDGLVDNFSETPMVVTDAKAFAKEVVRELNDDTASSGKPAVHEMFDYAFRRAFDNGAEGIEEGVRCEACSKVVLRADAHVCTEDGTHLCKSCMEAA